jgi:hypothetical protein
MLQTKIDHIIMKKKLLPAIFSMIVDCINAGNDEKKTNNNRILI